MTDPGSPLPEAPAGRGRAAIAVDMGGTSCRAVLLDRRGVVLAGDCRPTGRATYADQVLVAAIGALQQAAATRGRHIAALAVGVPGHVDLARGRVSGSVNLRWQRPELGDLLARLVGVPTRVENDVNLAAVGEAARGVGRAMKDFAVLALGTGVGGALVLDGRLRRGARHAAGELGFLACARDQLAHGPRMGMEAVLGGPAIAARARRWAGPPEAAGRTDATQADAAAVFSAHRRGDQLARQVVEEVVDHVAMVVIDLCAILDVEGVVLDGSVGRALAPELPRIAERVDRHVPYPVRLSVSTLRPSAALVGASVCALRLLAGEPA